MDPGELHEELNFIVKVVEIREWQKRVPFLLLEGSRGGFFSIQKKEKFFKRRNSEHGVSVALDMSVFRDGLKY